MTLLTALPAVATISWLGFGLLFLLLRKPAGFRLSFFEAAGWAWLLGCGGVSSLLALGGLVLKGQALTLLVWVASGLTGIAGWRKGGARASLTLWPVAGAAWEKGLSMLWLGGLVAAGILAARQTLIYDGLLIWEFKARAAFLADGVLPALLFSDPTRAGLHPTYPLLLPLTELWVYLAAGKYDQQAIGAILPLFYGAAAAILYGAVGRGTGKLWAGAIGALLPVFIPGTLLQCLPLLQGYADFPLAAVWLAAVAALLWKCEGDDGREQAQLPLAAACGALLLWTKQEGLLLWGALIVTTSAATGLRQWRKVLVVAAPGGVVLAVWKGVLALLHAPEEAVFHPLNAESVQMAYSRLWPVVNYGLHELGNTESWGLLWYVVPVALACLWWRRRDVALPLTLAVVLPLMLDVVPYLFTALPLRWHLETSLARLVLQAALVAILAIGLAAGSGPRQPKPGDGPIRKA